VQGRIEVDGDVYLGDATTDNLRVMGLLQLQGDTIYTGGVTIDVASATALHVKNGAVNDLVVDTLTHNVTIPGTLAAGSTTVTGRMNISNGLTVTSDATVNGSALVAGRMSVSNGLTVTSDATINGNAVVTGTLAAGSTTVNGRATVTNGLVVTSGATFNDNMTITSDGSIGIGTLSPATSLDIRDGGLRLWSGVTDTTGATPNTLTYAIGTNDMYVKGRLEVDGDVYLGDQATVDNLKVTGILDLTGQTSYNSPLSITTTDPNAFLVRKAGGAG
ncbi:MAG: hypothetical protein HQL20_04510, partial [Candidatus Omnitrophica bacterium]|nr:hypothetical protein [Candidatus Omnitrophota bacterium]